ncbi:hypothetical protein [Phascolarctobacterium faecium]|uniref:hypothetical protein n=1 Tax=Phascolarctobacterium faecium TaxID=33025 RepID=UPI003521AF6A
MKREDGSTIEVGSAIEGMQSDMRELDGRVNRMGVEIKEVGAPERRFGRSASAA